MGTRFRRRTDRRVAPRNSLTDSRQSTCQKDEDRKEDGRSKHNNILPKKGELTPSTAPLGSIQNSNEVYDAAIYCNKGVIKLNGKKGEKIPVPEGEWKLLEYTINLPDPAKSYQGRRALTLIAASGTNNCKTVKVEKGKTVAFPFGGPYTPIVRVSSIPSGRLDEQADRVFYDQLGPERAGARCRAPNCERGAVALSMLCRVHHFESIQGRACPFSD